MAPDRFESCLPTAPTGVTKRKRKQNDNLYHYRQNNRETTSYPPSYCPYRGNSKSIRAGRIRSVLGMDGGEVTMKVLVTATVTYEMTDVHDINEAIDLYRICIGLEDGMNAGVNHLATRNLIATPLDEHGNFAARTISMSSVPTEVNK